MRRVLKGWCATYINEDEPAKKKDQVTGEGVGL